MIAQFLNSIRDSLKDYRPHKELLTRFRTKGFPIRIDGPQGVLRSLLLAELNLSVGGRYLVITPTEREANSLYRDLDHLHCEASIFPGYGTITYSGVEPQAAVLGERVKQLMKILQKDYQFTIIPIRSLLQPLPPRDFLKNLFITISKGQEIDPVYLEELLGGYGYLRVPTVSVPGEFALRGEVLDIFLHGFDEAVRIIFEFDIVEEIRRFNPITQSSSDSIEKVETVTIYPVKEFIWTEERIEGLSTFFKEKSGNDFSSLLAELAEKRVMPHEELFFPLSFTSTESILEYIGKDTTVVLIEEERLLSTAESVRKEIHELYAKKEQSLLPKPGEILLSAESLIQGIERKISFPSIKNPDDKGIEYSFQGPRSFFGNMFYFREELTSLIESGYEVTIFAESESQAGRIANLLRDFDIRVLPVGISEGFSLPDQQIIAIAESEIFGRRKRIPASVKKARSKAIDTFVELSPGDFVVHVNYGIGRFLGIERIKAAGTERDYIKLEYADEENIFIPIEQVNLVQRYIGHEGRAPRLDLIGGKAWEKRKNRVRKSVEDLADMLISLYAKRKKAKGYPFPKDDDWQLEFEAAFPFQETEDQLHCIRDVKQDMESGRPMDRLICGDVGYGKTEVAMRAAFKAVMGGRQVAILAPTTILTEQHYENFEERFNRYPVKIGMVSRFVPKKSQKDLIKKLADGELDILLGTHRLLQKDVQFKNLGLLVVDEEQRFGVKDKERLKELKLNVDCLTLSATPIPRTLHMSMLKIRDISLLATPPSTRRPIETFIREFSDEVIVEAIRREVEREGQVFYLHNRVETLEDVQLFLRKMIPEVFIEIVHGQMGARQIEDIMHRFIQGSFQVLVATTIIENGIDIPNVNTILIDRADIYGISQLYQLRGRVGRSDRIAYAYLLYPEQRALSEIAMKRLQIISDHTDLGSGFKIALKDLEVRGAGNLLGRQQSGDILSVGFDMYIRLLDQAINEKSEKEKEVIPEVYLELDYSGYIPDQYIRDSTKKMEVYKKIAAIQTDGELSHLHSELIDRYGPMPDEVASLLSIAEVKIVCHKLHIQSLKERKGRIEIEFGKVSAISVDRVLRLIRESGGSVLLDPDRPNILLMQTGAIGLHEKSEFIRERLSMLLS
ncbi:MAG: transcription-repair coupling factor [Spirochaetales bacterium]|nr:transcription-repair coupling factor [Spirochaetales bacterium]